MGKKVTYTETIRAVLKAEGPLAFYRGAMAAGTGSIVFRSTGFSTFELFYTKWATHDHFTKKIPFSGGIEWRTFIAGWISGSFRAILECPFEYAKVKR